MKATILANRAIRKYEDPTGYQNSTLRYVPPVDFPPFLAQNLGRAKVMRVFITLDEYYNYKTGEFFPDYDIGKPQIPVKEMHYPYDWEKTVPAPSGTRFVDYLTSHSRNADTLLLCVRRLEREVSDGIISYDKYEEIFCKAVEYCKTLAPNIHYIECCNEVELEEFGALSSEEYYKIYLRGYHGVKSLNQKHNYDIPLIIGGDGVPSPLVRIDTWRGFLKLISETPSEEPLLEFYTYHHYDNPARSNLLRAGYTHEADEIGIVDRYRMITDLHESLLSEFGLPEAPVFMDEWGKCTHTGYLTDNLRNATGNLLTFNAQVHGKFGKWETFPWCTFHNPTLQMSYTQFVLRDDGGYNATPNALAMMILHELSGEIVKTRNVTGKSIDAPYQVLAVRNGNDLSAVCCNPRGESDTCLLHIEGLESGAYTMEEYLCDSTFNNCVTGTGSGIMECTAVSSVTVNGRFTVTRTLETNAFLLLKFKKL